MTLPYCNVIHLQVPDMSHLSTFVSLAQQCIRILSPASHTPSSSTKCWKELAQPRYLAQPSSALHPLHTSQSDCHNLATLRPENHNTVPPTHSLGPWLSAGTKLALASHVQGFASCQSRARSCILPIMCKVSAWSGAYSSTYLTISSGAPT